MWRQREVHGGGGATVGRPSPTQLDRVYVWPGTKPATCPDISEDLLRAADISICPEEKREGCVTPFSCAGTRVYVRVRQGCALSPMRAGARARCFVFHIGEVTWKISSKGQRDAEDSQEEADGSIPSHKNR